MLVAFKNVWNTYKPEFGSSKSVDNTSNSVWITYSVVLNTLCK